MLPTPDHLSARRRRARERTRRRRRAAVVAVMAALVSAAVVVGASSGSSPRRRPQLPAPAAITRAPASVVARRLRIAAAAARTLQTLIAAGRPVYCGGHHGNAVAFTFDDGPGVYTHYALRKLTAAHQRATFFVVGKSMRSFPGFLRRELRVAALGDHTAHHLDLVTLPPAQAYAEIAGAQKLIERQSGRPVILFRPPYGAHDPAIDAMVRRLGMIEVMWSVDSADSLGANYLGIIHNVERGLRPGAIIELHENRGQTIRALTTLLPVLRRRHLRSVSLLSLLSSDPPSRQQLRRGELACFPAGVGVGGGGGVGGGARHHGRAE